MDFKKLNQEKLISENQTLFAQLVGDKIKNLIRCSLNKTDLGDENFLKVEGALLIELESNIIIGLNGQDELNSIVVWLERSDKEEVNEDFYLFDDEIYPYTLSQSNESFIDLILNKRVVFIDLIYQQIFPNSRFVELPNEVGIIIGIEGGIFLTVTHYLFNKYNDLDLKVESYYPVIDNKVFKIKRITS
ncbi:hypothetical protein [Flammeovirga aprica]|uniref:Uncharacterized protein n=1 Tax=Flammeovirga aprica JL-4 TaxID=694437 RepID=A0A7X9XDM1_9BACT|nr:hypothetical protein [Flammeovirga aprica]NME72940.1 hypothetical protein [Flammeovirga aprica JL-4]